MPKISQPRTPWKDRSSQDKRNRIIQRILLPIVLLAPAIFIIKRHTSITEMVIVVVLGALVAGLISLIFPTKW